MQLWDKKKSEQHKIALSISMPNNIKIEVTDSISNSTTTYDSINAAAKALDVFPQSFTKIFIPRETQQRFQENLYYQKNRLANFVVFFGTGE
jgi:hypothetical protein